MSKANALENDVKKKVKDLLTHYGWKHWPVAAGRFGIGGLSDRMAVRGTPGAGCIFMAVEVKLRDSKGTALQEAFLADVRAQGGIGLVVNQGNLGKFEELLRAISEAYPRPGDVPEQQLRFWYHPESNSLFTTRPGEADPRSGGDGALVEELDEPTYRQLERDGPPF